MRKPGVVKTSVVEVSPVVSFEEGAIVFKVEPVTIVPIPCGVIIIGVAGEISFAYCGGGIISAYINPGSGHPETDTGADEYLSITFRSNEAGGGHDCGEDK